MNLINGSNIDLSQVSNALIECYDLRIQSILDRVGIAKDFLFIPWIIEWHDLFSAYMPPANYTMTFGA